MVYNNLHYLPLSVFILLPSTFVITYIIAILLDHVEVELPYISDTGTNPPESCIFAQLLNITAFLAAATIYVRYKQVEQYFRDNLSPESGKILMRNKIALCVGILSALGLSMVANFREIELFKVHIVGATMAFGCGAIYCWLQTIMSFNMYPFLNTLRMAQFRLILSMIITCTFTTSCICGPLAFKYYNGTNARKWEPEDGGFGLHLTSAISEWISAICLDFFILSYVREHQRISMSSPKIFFEIEIDFQSQPEYGNSNDDTIDILPQSTRDVSIISSSSGAIIH